MGISETLLITSDPISSGLIWFVLLSGVLWLARASVQRAIRAVASGLRSSMRAASRMVLIAEKNLVRRNREVLLNSGLEAAERIIAREFERMEITVTRELAEYPNLHRRIDEAFTHVEADYRQSAVVPPSPLVWSQAVEEVAKIPSKSDPLLGEVLESIHQSLVRANDNALNEYRLATAERHQHLKDIVPRWQQIQKCLDKVGGQVDSLLERAKTISKNLFEYERILQRTDQAERLLSSSALVQFFIASFVLAVAVGGAMINFSLIARPMAEMVGANTLVAGFRTSEVAALVIIFVEIVLGLFLMEALRVTRLFPVIGALNDRNRIIMAWVAFGFLFALAGIESGLAFMREILAQDELATNALLRGDEINLAVSEYAWITTAAQMGMGFVLPFVLVLVAIPLESFVHSLRTVLGIVAVIWLRLFAALLRFLGVLAFRCGELLCQLYDVIIFLPLWAESLLSSYLERRRLAARDRAVVMDELPVSFSEKIE